MGHTRLAIVDPSNRFADIPFDLTFDTTTDGNDKKRVHLQRTVRYNHKDIDDTMVRKIDGIKVV